MGHFTTNADVRHDDFPWCHVEWMSDAQMTGAEQLMLVRATFEPGAAGETDAGRAAGTGRVGV